MRQSKPSKSYPKEDGMSMNDKDERSKAVMVLLDAKRKEKKKQTVPVKITKGYKFVEKSKYERLMANN